MKSDIDVISLVESFRFSVQNAVERRDAGQYIATVILQVDAAEELLALIDAPVVHARWIDQSSDGSLWACSECGWLEEFPSDKPKRFCAGCAARMDADAPERAGKDGRDG